MTTVLLTGFEPFDGADHNSSWEAVQLVAHEWSGSDTLVHGCLPVGFGRAGDVLIDLITEHSPDIVIATGVAGGRTHVTPERIAINLQDARIPDNAGAHPAESAVVGGGPDAYFTRLPVAEMVERMMAAGVPASVSLTAGTYVAFCNIVDTMMNTDTTMMGSPTSMMNGTSSTMGGMGSGAGHIHFAKGMHITFTVQ